MGPAQYSKNRRKICSSLQTQSPFQVLNRSELLFCYLLCLLYRSSCGRKPNFSVRSSDPSHWEQLSDQSKHTSLLHHPTIHSEPCLLRRRLSWLEPAWRVSPQPFCCPRIPGTRSQLPQSTCLEIMTLNMLRLGLEQIICREQTVL